MNAHHHQRQFVAPRKDMGPVLNAACKEDPAKLSQYGVVNLDVCTYDEQTRRDLTELPNFVHGSVLEMSKLFAEGHFKTIVLGEYLEHCTKPAAVTSLNECRKILADDGILLLTFPLDDRAPEAQHAKHLLKVWVEGETGHDITVWHQTVWTDPMLEELFAETGWKVKHRTALNYGFVRHKPGGWAIQLQKN